VRLSNAIVELSRIIDGLTADGINRYLAANLPG